MKPEEKINLIAGRIRDEWRKHSTSINDWPMIAAKKLYSEWDEFYNEKHKEEYSKLGNSYMHALLKVRELELLNKSDAVEFCEWCSNRHEFNSELQLWRLQYFNDFTHTTEELYNFFKNKSK